MKKITDEEIRAEAEERHSLSDLGISLFIQGATWYRSQIEDQTDVKNKASIAGFEHIIQLCDRLTTGNVAHIKNTIKGSAIRALEFIQPPTKRKEEEK